MKQTSSQPRLDGKIPGRIKYTFALGALGKDMIYGMIATFSMIYFTDIIKVNPVFIGVMFFVAKLWDAFNDLFMGMIVDNTRSRWGKFIPWLVIGTLVNSIVFVVLFTDFHLDGAAQGDLDHLAEIRNGFIQHDLQVFKEGTVVELDEGKGLAVAYGAYPAADEKLRAVGGRLAEKLANENFFHIKEPLFR